MPEEPLTKEEQLKIASEVLEGKRPESDLQKHGLSFGKTIEGDEAKQILLDELKSLGINLDDDEPLAEPEAE